MVQVKRILTTDVDHFLTAGATRLASLAAGLRVPGAAAITPSSVDARMLPAKFNAQGKRHREFTDACDNLGEVAWADWPVTGPRTCRWFSRYIKEVNTIPQARTGQWMKELGINDSDRVKYEHSHLCDMLQMATTYDQLDVSSLGCFELLVRRLQMLEEAYGANPKAPRFDAQSHFMGQGKKTVAVAPALVAHVAGELRDEAAVAKERRKAREEASLRDKK